MATVNDYSTHCRREALNGIMEYYLQIAKQYRIISPKFCAKYSDDEIKRFVIIFEHAHKDEHPERMFSETGYRLKRIRKEMKETMPDFGPRYSDDEILHFVEIYDLCSVDETFRGTWDDEDPVESTCQALRSMSLSLNVPVHDYFHCIGEIVGGADDQTLQTLHDDPARMGISPAELQSRVADNLTDWQRWQFIHAWLCNRWIENELNYRSRAEPTPAK